jgi:hypothetical protein
VGNGEPVPKTMRELMMKALSAALVHCPSLKSELDDSRKLVSLVQIVDNQKPKPISGVIALNMAIFSLKAKKTDCELLLHLKLEESKKIYQYNMLPFLYWSEFTHNIDQCYTFRFLIISIYPEILFVY